MVWEPLQCMAGAVRAPHVRRIRCDALLLQELVNVMWAISCMEWSPPMLYWRGLLDAARANFGRFNAQDLANCISAGARPVFIKVAVRHCHDSHSLG
jgi:hypothetical protein